MTQSNARVVRRVIAAGLLVVLLAACSTAPTTTQVLGAESGPGDAEATTPPQPDMLRPVALGYELQPGDEIDLRYLDQPQHDREKVRIAPDGTISAPFLGSVSAAGRSVVALESELRERHAAMAESLQRGEYRLQAGDEMEIKFPYVANLNESIKVRPDGMLQLQLVGTVRAQGLTPEALQVELETRYARYLRKPNVAVIIRNTVSPMLVVDGQRVHASVATLRPVLSLRQAIDRQVFVGGEVMRPGVLPYRQGLSLMQAVIEAGGQRPSGEVQRVAVLRRGPDGSATVVQRDLTLVASQDLLLQPSDIVVLPKTKVAGFSEMLDEYVFKIFPFIRNSSFSYVYDARRINSQ